MLPSLRFPPPGVVSAPSFWRRRGTPLWHILNHANSDNDTGLAEAASEMVQTVAMQYALSLTPGAAPSTLNGTQASLAVAQAYPDQLAGATLSSGEGNSTTVASFALPATLDLGGVGDSNETSSRNDIAIAWALVTERLSVYSLANVSVTTSVNASGLNASTQALLSTPVSLILVDSASAAEVAVSNLPANASILIRLPIAGGSAALPAGLADHLPANDTELAAYNFSVVPAFWNETSRRWEDGGCVLIRVERSSTAGDAVDGVFACTHLTTYVLFGFVRINIIDVPVEELLKEFVNNTVAIIFPSVLLGVYIVLFTMFTVIDDVKRRAEDRMYLAQRRSSADVAEAKVWTSRRLEGSKDRRGSKGRGRKIELGQRRARGREQVSACPLPNRAAEGPRTPLQRSEGGRPHAGGRGRVSGALYEPIEQCSRLRTQASAVTVAELTKDSSRYTGKSILAVMPETNH